MTNPRPPALSTLAVGSLPHTQLELAMQQAFMLDVPTLPQLPRTDPAEYMLPQALEKLPGLRFDEVGQASVDRLEWERGSSAFQEQLDAALEGKNLEAFEPGGAFCRAWRPFLWEVENRRVPFAKAQLTGPLTARWVTTLTGGVPLENVYGLGAQIVRLVLVRAMAMAKAIRDRGATPLIFFDEPGLFAYSPSRPSHAVELQNAGILIGALKKAGALVGVHCCGNTHWPTVLNLPVDYFAIDAKLTLEPLLRDPSSLDAFLDRGGSLVLGIVPTNEESRADVDEVVDLALARMGERRERILSSALLSPACGLALRTVGESQAIYADLQRAQGRLRG